MSESDRELYFSDFVIELQTAEDERRRRIRDARHRAEKAQRESFIELLEKMAKDGKIVPSTKWRNIEDSLSSHPTYGLVKSQDRDGPKELFQDFLEEWNATYRRDRIFLSRLLQSINRTNSVLIAKSYDEFRKSLLDAASHSPEQYGDIRMILNSESPISSARVYFNEIFHRDTEHAKAATLSMNRRGQSREDSSEDEGEIIEDEEVEDVAEIRNDTL
jgi:FF domain